MANVSIKRYQLVHSKRRIQGRHPLQTSNALGAAASQIGPDAQAAAAILNKQAGLSHGKVVRVFDTLFGIQLTPAGAGSVLCLSKPFVSHSWFENFSQFLTFRAPGFQLVDAWIPRIAISADTPGEIIMPDRTEPPADNDDRIGEAVAWYYRATEGGIAPSPAEFLARYPDIRPELESFLADKDAFDKAAGAPASPDATLPHRNLPPAGDTLGYVPDGDPTLTVAHIDSEPSTSAPPGTVRYFGDYELIAEIARGGMGVVFRARQVSLNREVALKMILSGQLASTADVARFHAEAEAAANLDHPHILPIYEIGEHLGQQYFAMKYVPGGNLGCKVADCLKDPRAAVALLVKVCRAVDFAHRRGILHRDLKPGNILLDVDGTPYVTDFGLAKKVEGDSGLTQSGAIVGTPSYMAPEQARAEKGLTTGVDVYALGAILYELLTGQPPFRGPTTLDTIIQVLEGEPAPPASLNPKVSPELAAVALTCLQKEPARRYESAAGLADELERWLADLPVRARPVGAIRSVLRRVRRQPILLLLALWGCIAVLASYRALARAWTNYDPYRTGPWLGEALFGGAILAIFLFFVAAATLTTPSKRAKKRIQEKDDAFLRVQALQAQGGGHPYPFLRDRTDYRNGRRRHDFGRSDFYGWCLVLS